MQSQKDDVEFAPAKIRRARIDTFTIYEISDTELEILSHGSPDSIYLNFGIALLSISISFLISLWTTTIDSIKTYDIFISITIICAIVGFILLAIWFKKWKSTSELIIQIKNRMPPEGMQETT
jgi:hypothetical protein